MEQIVKKINYHKRLQEKDMNEILCYQREKLKLENYVSENLDIMKYHFPLLGVACYNNDENTVIMNLPGLKEESLMFYKNMTKFQRIIYTPLYFNDTYNFYILNTIFHELEHAKQQKLMIENPKNKYARLLKISFDLMARNSSSYRWYHNRYYMEYLANINAVKNIYEFMKEQDVKIKKQVAYLLNQEYADMILHAYGIHKEKNYLQEYSNPIEFVRFLVESLYQEKEQQEALKLIYSIKSKNTEENINDLYQGKEISKETKEELSAIRDGKVQSINILEDINKTYTKKLKR